MKIILGYMGWLNNEPRVVEFQGDVEEMETLIGKMPFLFFHEEEDNTI